MTIRPLTAQPDLQTHTGFLLAEDKALKDYLSNITVPNPKPGAPAIEVPVYFRWPEGERQIKYPFITLDALAAEPAYELFHSDHIWSTEGLYRPSVAPSLPPPPGGWGLQDYEVRNYLPFRLVYQVSVFTRTALHDRYLRSIFMTDVFPQRPFWVACDTDGTWRRTEQVNFAASDTSETSESGTKRIFRKIYTVSMLAEIPQERFQDAMAYKALRVLIPIVDRDYIDRYYTNILEGVADPIGTFTQEQRDLQGEYLHVAHEGEEVPTPS